jgi:hypothetical protein
MIGRQHEVASLNELLAALADPNVRSIAVTTDVFEALAFVFRRARHSVATSGVFDLPPGTMACS